MKPGVLAIVCLLFVSATLSLAQSSQDVRQQRQELQKIQQDVARGRQRLDSLRREEARVQNAIGDYNRRLGKEQRDIDRLTGQLQRLRADIGDAERTLNDRQTALADSRQRFLQGLRHFYLTSSRTEQDLWTSPAAEFDANRKMIYLTSLVTFQSGNLALASKYFDQSLDQLSRLTGQQGKVSRQKERRETTYAMETSRKEKQERALTRLQDLKRQEADRVAALQQAAREMEALIARLEAAQKKGQQTGATPQLNPNADFAVLRGQLPAPVRGNIVVRYGLAVDSLTNLKSFSPGVTIKSVPGAPVKSVAYGLVAYTGNLRGYGNFVIINHDNQFYTTYAGLARIEVSANQFVDAGTELGVAGNDGLVKFELRKGKLALDPTDWIPRAAF